MRIFWNKNAKITSAAGGFAPRPPRCYSCLLLQVCRVHF